MIFFDARWRARRVDHFILHPFVGCRSRAARAGAWVVESRLSADRDPHPALFRLLVRTLAALEVSPRAGWVATCFAVRAVDLLGHRPRLDRCMVCGRPYPFASASLDIEAGGIICGHCAVGLEAMTLPGAVVGTLKRLRGLRWEETLRLSLAAPLEAELCAVVESLIARLAGASSLSRSCPSATLARPRRRTLQPSRRQ
jgi:DNA repair protein RecO (recombination protein O)